MVSWGEEDDRRFQQEYGGIKGFYEALCTKQLFLILFRRMLERTLATAYMLGAEVIEKHFTLDKTLPGNDHYHAGNPDDFRKAISNFKCIDAILGKSEKTVLDCELIPRREARRSLVITKDLAKGQIIQANDLMPKRPGTGISPIYTDVVVGRAVKSSVKEDTILTWEMI